eukprot:gene39528-48124_t
MDETIVLPFDSCKTYNDVALKLSGRAFTLDDKVANDWAWKLVTGKNLMVFGLGDKYTLLHKFARDCLKGEDLIEVDGNPKARHNFASYNLQSSWMKSIQTILEVISQKIFKQEDEFIDIAAINDPETLIQACKQVADLLDIHYGRAQDEDNETRSELEHSEDEHVTADDINQHEEEVVAEDFKCRGNDSINTSLNSGRYTNNQARMQVRQHPCEYRYVERIITLGWLNPSKDHPCLMGGEGARDLSESSRNSDQYSRSKEETMSILSGFPTTHKEFLQLLCKYCIEKRNRMFTGKSKDSVYLVEPDKKKIRLAGSAKNSKSSKQGKGMESPDSADFACVPIDEVLRQGTARLILKSKQDIHEMCKNFFDHRMLQEVRSSQFGDFLKVLLPPTLMEVIVTLKFA